MSSKPTYKDAQMTVRISGDTLEQMKAEAKEKSLSLADFVLFLYQQYKEVDTTQKRLEALERVVFQKTIPE